jgi:site-specific DNA recombinase
MDQGKLIDIRTYGQRFTNSPNEKFLLMILGSQAKLENDNKVINVKRGLRARCEMGLWSCTAPTGYLNSKNVDKRCHVEMDVHRAPMVRKMFEKVAYEKYSGRLLYQWLKDRNFKTKNGKHLTLSNVYILLRNTFYYGMFEYPKKSSQWFKGIHEPLITKELFDIVQENIANHVINKTDKEFTFTKMMTCGVCGSGITADEKFKKLKNGEINRYVYYICTKHNDSKCKNPIVREEVLIEQLASLMDTIKLDEIAMKEKIREEVQRIKRFQSSLLGKKDEMETTDIDIRNYTKYILRDGKIEEKRELLSCLRSRILLKGRLLFLK